MVSGNFCMQLSFILNTFKLFRLTMVFGNSTMLVFETSNSVIYFSIPIELKSFVSSSHSFRIDTFKDKNAESSIIKDLRSWSHLSNDMYIP
ncbi:hypothetical protein BT93_C0986 [Corymbia citriodora subsp. variegata]|nr:hypothetical protein BT93_C0986 [Corymbia citriodora subsp. variegata]